METFGTNDFKFKVKCIVIEVSIVYDSNFKGQTEVLANRIATGINSVKDASSHLIHVDHVEENWNVLHRSQAIVFGSPTYVGSISGKFKLFVEKLAGEVWLKRMWENKIATGFTVSAGRSECCSTQART
ncbi:MAG TPA: flavodoxin family protein, partial [Dehalococcoidia bacterium]|nr:flavodoxin family protein [Dehalococcoidia bacterium]